MDAAGAGRLTDDDPAAALRASGRRVTRQRLAVHEALKALGGHRGVDEVEAWLGEHGNRLPLASIYNALDALAATGLVSVAHRGPPRALYEVAGGAHDHFECRACGAILDVEPVTRRPLRPPVPGALIDEVVVTYRGLCPRCASAHG